MSVIYPLAWRNAARPPTEGGLTQEQAHRVHRAYRELKLEPADIAYEHDLPLQTIQTVLDGTIWPRLARFWLEVGLA